MKKETNVKEFLMKYGFVIILILVTAFFGITTNNFITVKNLFSILHNAAPVFAFCVGAAMVIMSGMVDLSVYRIYNVSVSGNRNHIDRAEECAYYPGVTGSSCYMYYNRHY